MGGTVDNVDHESPPSRWVANVVAENQGQNHTLNARLSNGRDGDGCNPPSKGIGMTLVDDDDDEVLDASNFTPAKRNRSPKTPSPPTTQPQVRRRIQFQIDRCTTHDRHWAQFFLNATSRELLTLYFHSVTFPTTQRSECALHYHCGTCSRVFQPGDFHRTSQQNPLTILSSLTVFRPSCRHNDCERTEPTEQEMLDAVDSMLRKSTPDQLALLGIVRDPLNESDDAEIPRFRVEQPLPWINQPTHNGGTAVPQSVARPNTSIRATPQPLHQRCENSEHLTTPTGPEIPLDDENLPGADILARELRHLRCQRDRLRAQLRRATEQHPTQTLRKDTAELRNTIRELRKQMEAENNHRAKEMEHIKTTIEELTRIVKSRGTRSSPVTHTLRNEQPRTALDNSGTAAPPSGTTVDQAMVEIDEADRNTPAPVRRTELPDTSVHGPNEEPGRAGNPAEPLANNWVEVVRRGGRRAIMNPELKQRYNQASRRWTAFSTGRDGREQPDYSSNGNWNEPEPKLQVLYFSNIRRGHPKLLRQLLQELVDPTRKSTIRCIDFIGGGVAEVLCEEESAPQVIAVMSMKRHKHLNGVSAFSPFSGVARQVSDGNADPTISMNSSLINAELVRRRARRMLTRFKSVHVQKFYLALETKAGEIIENARRNGATTDPESVVALREARQQQARPDTSRAVQEIAQPTTEPTSAAETNSGTAVSHGQNQSTGVDPARETETETQQ